jgi:hypothetical protein
MLSQRNRCTFHIPYYLPPVAGDREGDEEEDVVLRACLSQSYSRQVVMYE